MDSFLNYSEEKWPEIDPEMLDVVKDDHQYHIYCGSGPLLTPGGHEFLHPSERVTQLMITDLMLNPRKREQRLSAPLLYAFHKDVFDKTGDQFVMNWDKLLLSDPFVTIKTTGKFSFQPFVPENNLFSFAFITHSLLIKSVNDFVNTTIKEFIIQETDLNPFPELLFLSYSRLSPEKKVVMQALIELHNSGIVLPLVFISGFISATEYSKGLIALKIQDEQQYSDILLDVVNAGDYLECLAQRSDTGHMATYIIRGGESDFVEFKSTFRWDLRAGKTNQAVERASLKTMAAFLNSAGGTLLIGVRDDGSIEGIESDKFVNEDKFLLHLWTLIRTCFGREISPFIRTTLEKAENKTVCLVHCIQSSRPVFLRQPGFDEAFYIRVGPSSNAMDISEALKYIKDHFTET